MGVNLATSQQVMILLVVAACIGVLEAKQQQCPSECETEGYVLRRQNQECTTGKLFELAPGVKSSLERCAYLSQNKSREHFFYGTGSNNGKCYGWNKNEAEDEEGYSYEYDYEYGKNEQDDKEGKEEDECTNFQTAEYNYYQLCDQDDFVEHCDIKKLEDKKQETPASGQCSSEDDFKMLKKGQKCKSSDSQNLLADQPCPASCTLENCAQLCESTPGCEYFLRGMGGKQNECLWEKVVTQNSAVCNAWVDDDYDFYRLCRKKHNVRKPVNEKTTKTSSSNNVETRNVRGKRDKRKKKSGGKVRRLEASTGSDDSGLTAVTTRKPLVSTVKLVIPKKHANHDNVTLKQKNNAPTPTTPVESHSKEWDTADCKKCVLNPKNQKYSCCAKGGSWDGQCGKHSLHSFVKGIQACEHFQSTESQSKQKDTAMKPNTARAVTSATTIPKTTTKPTTKPTADCEKCVLNPDNQINTCCAKGGSWHGQCGKDSLHSFVEGIKACKNKSLAQTTNTSRHVHKSTQTITTERNYATTTVESGEMCTCIIPNQSEKTETGTEPGFIAAVAVLVVIAVIILCVGSLWMIRCCRIQSYRKRIKGSNMGHQYSVTKVTPVKTKRTKRRRKKKGKKQYLETISSDETVEIELDLEQNRSSSSDEV